MAQLLFLSVILTIATGVFADDCTNYQLTTKSFTTQDATIVADIAYISEFVVKCESSAVPRLYAELEGNILAVSTIGGGVYQVSWTEDPKDARSGIREVHIHNEEGYNSLKRLIRTGDDISSVSPLFTVVVNHPGTYTGPWFKSEFLATVIFFGIAYLAVSSRMKITA